MDARAVVGGDRAQELPPHVQPVLDERAVGQRHDGRFGTAFRVACRAGTAAGRRAVGGDDPPGERVEGGVRAVRGEVEDLIQRGPGPAGRARSGHAEGGGDAERGHDGVLAGPGRPAVQVVPEGGHPAHDPPDRRVGGGRHPFSLGEHSCAGGRRAAGGHGHRDRGQRRGERCAHVLETYGAPVRFNRPGSPRVRPPGPGTTRPGFRPGRPPGRAPVSGRGLRAAARGTGRSAARPRYTGARRAAAWPPPAP